MALLRVIYKEYDMSPEMQENTIDMMIKNKKQVTIKDALNALEMIDNALRPKTQSILTLKYRVR